MNDTTPLSSCNSDLFCFVLLPCLTGREATGSHNLLEMRMLLGSRRGRLKFHKTYPCVSAEVRVACVVSFIQAWYRIWGTSLSYPILVMSAARDME